MYVAQDSIGSTACLDRRRRRNLDREVRKRVRASSDPFHNAHGARCARSRRVEVEDVDPCGHVVEKR